MNRNWFFILLAAASLEAASENAFFTPFSKRYGSEEMRSLFSRQAKHSTWRQIWVALAEAEKEMGLPIQEEQIAEMKAHLQDIDFAMADQIEKEINHDVMAHVQTYGAVCPMAKPIIHLGATSCLVTDNEDAMTIRSGLAIVERKLRLLIHNLSGQAEKYKDLPCLSYTHFQAAQPTTVGKRFALWLMDFWLDLQELTHRQNELRCLGAKGATGTQASFLELLEGDSQKVRELEEKFTEKLGFTQVFPISGQTYSRKQDMQVLASLSGIAVSAHKMCTDLRLLAHDKEIDEPFGEKQVGSSAMPYKRNPMMCERICSLARHVLSLSNTLEYNAATQWLERTLDDSANRRIAIPEAFLAIDMILDEAAKIVKNCIVYPEVIGKNLERELPFMATENILMASVKNGADRQEIHEKLRQFSQIAGNRVKKEGKENNLIELIESDETIPLSSKQLEELLNVSHFIGRAIEQVEDFLEEIYGKNTVVLNM